MSDPSNSDPGADPTAEQPEFQGPGGPGFDSVEQLARHASAAADAGESDAVIEIVEEELGEIVGEVGRPGRRLVVLVDDALIVGGSSVVRIEDRDYRHQGPADGWTRHRIVGGIAAAAPPPPPWATPASGPAPPVPVPPVPVPPVPVPAFADHPEPPDRVVELRSDPVLVRGLRCQRGHLVNPRARLCPLCGDNMQNRSLAVNADGSLGELGPRPPLGVVVLPDGRSFQLSRTTVVGRAPTSHADVAGGDSDSITVDIDNVSRSHLRFVLDEWTVSIEDLGSANGTWVGSGATARRLEPQRPEILNRGTDIHLGSTPLHYQPTSAWAE